MSIATLRKAFMDTYFPPVPAMGIFHFERADMSRYPTFVSRGHAYAGIGPPRKTLPEVVQLMRQLGAALAQKGYVWRSGAPTVRIGPLERAATPQEAQIKSIPRRGALTSTRPGALS